MKNQYMVLALSIVLASTSVQAYEIYDDEEYDRSISAEQAGGLGLGAVLGGVLGGPIGAIAGGVAGGMTVSASETKQELVTLQSSLQNSRNEVNALKKTNYELTQQALVHRAALTKKRSTTSFDFSGLNKGFSLAVQFRHDSHLLEPAFKKQLTDIAQSFSGVDKLHIHLSGHADREGNDRYNQMLSEQRVRSVAKVLCQAGWPKQRMHISAHGERRPLSNENDKSGYVFDRRVGLLLTTAGAGI